MSINQFSFHKLNNKRDIVTRDHFINLVKHFESNAAAPFFAVKLDIDLPDSKLQESRYKSVIESLEALTQEVWDSASYINLWTLHDEWNISCRRNASPNDIEVVHTTDMGFPIYDGKVGDAFMALTDTLEGIAERLIARPQTEKILKSFKDTHPEYSLFRRIY